MCRTAPATGRLVGRATTLVAWAVLYADLAVWWWPALPLAVATYVTARLRVRSGVDAYAASVVGGG
ncbi:hypothetical protein [Streptomyces massasporeus]|uniref:hypothetical protein n=1 Tax=Streptomyces massasporeus TaxID=67324 RepID=UPI00366080E5